MNCPTCGHELTANTLDRCPTCRPDPPPGGWTITALILTETALQLLGLAAFIAAVLGFAWLISKAWG